MEHGDVQCDGSPECHIEILLPPQTERRDVMNAPSCFRHKCSHRSLQHVRHHLTHMCFHDGSSFFPLIFPSLLFVFNLKMPKIFAQTGLKYHAVTVWREDRAAVQSSRNRSTRKHQTHLPVLTKMHSVSVWAGASGWPASPVLHAVWAE